MLYRNLPSATATKESEQWRLQAPHHELVTLCKDLQQPYPGYCGPASLLELPVGELPMQSGRLLVPLDQSKTGGQQQSTWSSQGGCSVHRHMGWAVGRLAPCKEAGKGCVVSQCDALCHTCIGEGIWGHNNNLCLLTGMETRCSLHFGRLTH